MFKTFLIACLVAGALTGASHFILRFQEFGQVEVILFLGWLVAVFFLCLGPIPNESFLRWRVRWSARLSIVFGFAIALMIGIGEAMNESLPSLWTFLECAICTTLFVCMICFMWGGLLFLFVPLFLISSASSIKDSWKLMNETNSIEDDRTVAGWLKQVLYWMFR